jgi:hypothetical protein
MAEAHRAQGDKSSQLNSILGEFAAMGKKRIEDVANAQNEFVSMNACQEYATAPLEFLAEDSKRLFTDAQKLIEIGTRLWSNGWAVKGPSS